MTTQLTLMNGALRLIGEVELASTSEDREPRHVLDDVYTDGLNYCLEQGFWNWSLRDAEINEDATDPAFGYTSRFVVPSDWIRTAAISLSETYIPPLTNYVQQAGYWQANGTPLYVKYVSNDATTYGLKLSAWPISFVRYVETHLAAEICERLTQHSSKLEGLRKLELRRKLDAQTKDVMNEAVRFKPPGSWTASRSGFWFNRSIDGR